MYDIPNIKLHKWQEDCLARWFDNGSRGIVDVATGAGKTTLALAASYHLAATHPEFPLKVKIVVPKVFLAHQWRTDITRVLNVPREKIGLYYGNLKEDIGRPYMIYVLNTARRHAARHILDDMDIGHAVFLICDECHHLGSAENAHIFDFLPYISENRYFSLGLSATPEAENFDTTLVPALGKKIFQYSLSDAGHDRITSKYEIFSIAVHFTSEEQDVYDEFTDKIIRLKSKLTASYPGIVNSSGAISDKYLRQLAKRTDRIGDLARRLRLLYIRRKEVVHIAEARIACGTELMRRLLPDNRTILFTERIKTANALYEQLNRIYPSRISRYHSNMDTAEKQRALEKYRSGESVVIICCRALDEGLNVPETDAGVILSTGNSLRQRIQRIGRIVRFNNAEQPKKIYYLHIPETSESPDILLAPQSPQIDALNQNTDISSIVNPVAENLKILDTPYQKIDEGLSLKNDTVVHRLEYISAENRLKHPVYDALAEQVICDLEESGATPKQLRNAAEKLERGSVRTDFRLSEKICAERMKRARGDEREYLAAMLLLIRAGEV
jgi:superfamily II DNA or RNA helicase